MIKSELLKFKTYEQQQQISIQELTKLRSLNKNLFSNQKNKKCYICGDETKKLCNSHSIPRSVLNNIATDGLLKNPNCKLGYPLLKESTGKKETGTFKNICTECDVIYFNSYENKLDKNLNQKMLSEIVIKIMLQTIFKVGTYIQPYIKVKNSILQCNDKKIIENQPLYIISKDLQAIDINKELKSVKNYINSCKAKINKALKNIKNDEIKYYKIFEIFLDYVTPLAFQNALALVTGFDKRIINNYYDYNCNLSNIFISIYPLKKQTHIIMFMEDGNTKYKHFAKEFKKKDLNEKLEIINYMLFLYSEDIFFNETIKENLDNPKIIDLISTSTKLVLPVEEYKSIKKETIDKIINVYDLSNRKKIPNFLSKYYSLNKHNNNHE